jgi:transcriptional regulator with XRE-family HTH domain
VDIRKIIGENIRGFRVKHNWTQEKLAIRAKVHYNYIGNLERGERNIGAIKLSHIAKALGIDSYLLLKPDAYKEKE